VLLDAEVLTTLKTVILHVIKKFIRLQAQIRDFNSCFRRRVIYVRIIYKRVKLHLSGLI